MNKYDACLLQSEQYRKIENEDINKIIYLMKMFLVKSFGYRFDNNIEFLLFYSNYSLKDIANFTKIKVDKLNDIVNRKVKINNLKLSEAQKLEKFFLHSKIRAKVEHQKELDNSIDVFYGLNDINAQKREDLNIKRIWTHRNQILRK